MRLACTAVFAFALAANAQTSTPVTRTITATGNASISATPDKALVDVGVTTQAATAQDASTQNATQVSSVLSAIQTVLGPAADIKTIAYSLSPLYTNPAPGQNPTLTGYLASNIVEATITDLTLIGKVIDASVSAGANRVQGITFGLRDPDPVQAKALKAAAAAALSQAGAIASGLNVQIGQVLRASQGAAVVQAVLAPSMGAAAAVTPVEPGLVHVQGTVTVEVAIQ